MLSWAAYATRSSALFVFLLFSFCIGLRADAFGPGEIAEYAFTINPLTYPCPGGPCDTLVFLPDLNPAPPGLSWTVQIFDGRNLLGSYTNGACCSGEFIASGSLSTFGSPTVVDFTSLQDGTIQGLLVLTVANGSIDLFPQALLELFHSDSSDGGPVNGFTDSFLTAAITSAPEPSSSIVVGSAICGLLFLRFRRV